MSVYIGIDPGLTGAIAVLDESGRMLQAIRTPIIAPSGKGKSEYDLPAMVQALARWQSPDGGGIHLVTLEQVSAMPHDGVTSAFRFGVGVGIWRGVLSALKLSTIQARPQSWQRDALAGRPKGKMIKSSSVAAAQERWPTIPIKCKRDWGMADAAHIADYGRRQWRGEAPWTSGQA